MGPTTEREKSSRVARMAECHDELVGGEACTERLGGTQKWGQGATAMLGEVKMAVEMDRVSITAARGGEELRIGDSFWRGRRSQG